MNPLKTFTISVRPFYDQYNKCYKNILIINGYPQGPLNSLVRRVNFNDLSSYQKYQNNTSIRKFYEEEQVMNYIYE